MSTTRRARRGAVAGALLALALWGAGTGTAVAAPGVAAAVVAGDEATVFVSGSALDAGSTGRTPLSAPLIDLVATRTGKGYWLLAQDGGVFSYGDAAFYGSTGDIRLNQPVVAMTASTTGNGYLFVANDGGVFSFGDAAFHGSIPGVLPPGGRLNQPIVGIVPTATGGGYWMVAADGGVFAFGDAGFVGSLGANPPSAPIEAFVPTTTGNGYWMVAADGTTYPFGDAPAVSYAGDWQAPFVLEGTIDPAARVADAAPLPGDQGLAVLRADGGVDAARRAGLRPTTTPLTDDPPTVLLGAGERAVSVAVAPDGGGLWIGSSGRATPHWSPGDPGGGHTFVGTSGGRPVRWSACATIDWYYNPTYGPEGGLELMQAAMRFMGDLTGFTLRYAGTSAVRPIENAQTGTVVLGWHPAAATGGWARPISRNGRIVAAGLELDARQLGARELRFGPGGFGAILLHELGHVFGLGHPTGGWGIMRSGPLGLLDAGDLEGFAAVDARHGC